MKKSFNKVFWGFIIVVFNINIGPVNLMPDFLGYFIMSSGLIEIIDKFENKSFNTAKSIINFLFLYTLFTSVMNLLGIEDSFRSYGRNDFYDNFISYKSVFDLGLTIFISLIKLIATYKILSGTIELYLSGNQQLKAESMEKSQRLYTILSLIGNLGIAVSLNISNEYFVMTAVLLLIAVYIYYAVLLRRIRNDFNEELIED